MLKSCSRAKPGPRMWDTFFVTAYGAASRRRGASRSSNPLTGVNCEIRSAPDWRNCGQLTRSLYR